MSTLQLSNGARSSRDTRMSVSSLCSPTEQSSASPSMHGASDAAEDESSTPRPSIEKDSHTAEYSNNHIARWAAINRADPPESPEDVDGANALLSLTRGNLDSSQRTSSSPISSTASQHNHAATNHTDHPLYRASDKTAWLMKSSERLRTPSSGSGSASSASDEVTAQNNASNNISSTMTQDEIKSQFLQLFAMMDEKQQTYTVSKMAKMIEKKKEYERRDEAEMARLRREALPDENGVKHVPFIPAEVQDILERLKKNPGKYADAWSDDEGDVEVPNRVVVGGKWKGNASFTTPQTGSKRSRNAASKDVSTGTINADDDEDEDEEGDDENDKSKRLPKSKRAKVVRSHSKAIQDTKQLFNKPEWVGLPAYTPVSSITARYPNRASDTSQFFLGRYRKMPDGTVIDQQDKLVMNIIHKKTQEVKTIWHDIPKSWNDPHTITVLNRWRSQAIKRHTGEKQRKKIVRYDYAEREFIRNIVRDDVEFKQASHSDRPKVLTAKLNAHFVGKSLSGDQLDAYRACTNDADRLRIRPSRKRTMRTQASVSSELTRHKDDYNHGKIPQRRLTGWNIDNQSAGEEEDEVEEDEEDETLLDTSVTAIDAKPPVDKDETADDSDKTDEKEGEDVEMEG